MTDLALEVEEEDSGGHCGIEDGLAAAFSQGFFSVNKKLIDHSGSGKC